jgi:peptide/nickel transport system substrate-binding protein
MIPGRMSLRFSRRALLLAAVAGTMATIGERSARSAGRTRYGGRVAMHVPWPVGRIDPHRLDDIAAACFGECLFDTLYARDESGAWIASLAEGDPELDRNGLRVRLRAGVRFASGAPLDASAVAESIERARSHDAAAWLLDVPRARVDGDAVVFALHDATRLIRALASPLVGIVPPRFAPERPDGSGPLRAQALANGLRLARNPLAASGPAFLDAIDIEHATDLATSLRAFESGADDVGWLGSFLHEPRTGARNFDGGAVGWAVLKTGRDAGALDSPGTAQALADGVPYAALAPLVVGPSWTQTAARWTGSPCDLLTRDDAPWLAEVARALAAAMSTPSHEVTPRFASAADLAARRATRAFALMLDVTRPAGPGELGVLLGLAGADDPSTAARLARHPPRGAAPRALTRTMRTGVVGEVRLQGGRAPDLSLPASRWGRGIDWASANRAGEGPRA